MDEVVAELEAVLADLDAREDGEGTMIMRKPPAASARPSARAAPAPRRLALLAARACCSRPRSVGSCSRLATTTRRGEAPTGAGAAAGRRVLRPASGDGEEHSERVADATDGDPATYWTTETYQAFSKPGVGLVLDAGRRAPRSG